MQNDFSQEESKDSQLPPSTQQQEETKAVQEVQLEQQAAQEEEDVKAEMPAWLREEMEHGSPPAPEPEAAPRRKGYTAQLADLRAQLFASRREVNALRAERYQVTTRELGGCLIAWLIFMGIANLFIIVLGFLTLNASGGSTLITILGGIVAIAGVIATSNFKRWGVYTIMTIYSLNLVLSFIGLCASAGKNAPSSLITIALTGLGMGIYYSLVRSRWDMFE